MSETQYDQKPERRKSAILAALATVRTIGIFSSAVKFPTSYQYIYSVLPSAWRTTLTHKCFTVYSFHIAISYSSSIYFVIGTFLLYFSTMANAFKMSYQGKPLTRKRCTTYRSLQVLANHFNDCFSSVGIPGIVTCLLACFMISMYGFVRLLTVRSTVKNFKFPIGSICMHFWSYGNYSSCRKVV
ncbi:unnamed protein product [Allacma fusca]|uniref:Uncharacterized protein n=1 Tax=Allacma fusca TaxID=39272 RepID=A0A8J2JU22_9HEXA|nr:unnamed protein product [Allacma fusca]